jgi:hypothetical protein
LTPDPLSSAATVCLFAAGMFLLTGLISGVWKYRRILTSPDHRAPVYVDITHRAALLYSFACLVMMKLVEYSPYSNVTQLLATTVPIFFFAVAVATYVGHGIGGDTDNQFEKRTFVTTWGMALLILGEIGGISVLVWGFVVTEVL